MTKEWFVTMGFLCSCEGANFPVDRKGSEALLGLVAMSLSVYFGVYISDRVELGILVTGVLDIVSC